MGRFFLRWVVLAVALVAAVFLTQAVLSSFDYDSGFRLKWGGTGSNYALDALQLLVGVAFLAVVNASLGAILKFLTTPWACLTFGITSLIINALMMMLVGSLGIGFEVRDFLSAFVGSIGFSVINGILTKVLVDRDKKDQD